MPHSLQIKNSFRKCASVQILKTGRFSSFVVFGRFSSKIYLNLFQSIRKNYFTPKKLHQKNPAKTCRYIHRKFEGHVSHLRKRTRFDNFFVKGLLSKVYDIFRLRNDRNEMILGKNRLGPLVRDKMRTKPPIKIQTEHVSPLIFHSNIITMELLEIVTQPHHK